MHGAGLGYPPGRDAVHPVPGDPGSLAAAPQRLAPVPYHLGAERVHRIAVAGRLLVRVDGAGASHELISHLLSLSSRRRTALFTCGWAITDADEQAIGLLPATGWQAAVDQDGVVQDDKHVAEVTHLMRRAGRWPAGLRW